jgi:non-ribosomal peptide synthetase component E (peptide arylation enzyme)
VSVQEIIAELPKLRPDEFLLVRQKVEDLAKAKVRTIGQALLELAGTAEGLPRDMARRHDHYLYGRLG